MNRDWTGKLQVIKKLKEIAEEIVLAHSSEEVIMMHSEKIKAKYMKENV